MTFPSFEYLSTQARTTLKRFPLPLIFAFVATRAVLLQIGVDDVDNTRIISTCSLGFTISLGCNLFAARSSWRHMFRAAVALPLITSIAYWYWLAPHVLKIGSSHVLMFLVLNLVAHLFVAIAPYIQHGETSGFWRYNETLFIRFLLSALFTFVLFLGLALALFASEMLFNLQFSGRVYPWLFTLLTGVFSTWFFLAGIPSDYTALNTDKVFPKFLKIFAQYILVPLVTLYMLILYAYTLRIIVLGSLPRGGVSSLILCYSVMGILAVLLVTPLRHHKDSPWVGFFARFFFVATLPLIALLYLAIITRVNSYGITESRYYLLLIGAWLGFISLYFIFSRSKNIKLIPASLAILGLLSLSGPWNAFAVSKRSQFARLEILLIKNKLWKPGEKIALHPIAIPEKDAEQIRSIVEYIIARGNVKMLQPFISISIDSAIAAGTSGNPDANTYYDLNSSLDIGRILLPLFCNNCLYSSSGLDEETVTFEVDNTNGIEINGFSKAYRVHLSGYTDEKERLYISDSDYVYVALSKKDSTCDFVFTTNDKILDTISLSPLLYTLKSYPDYEYRNTIGTQIMTLDGSGPLKPRIIIESIQLIYIGNRYAKVDYLTATILLPMH